jgi:hypothetical protein
MYSVTGDWRRQHNEELFDVYLLIVGGDQIKKNEMGGT